MKEIKLDIEGMHCVSCEKIIAGELEDLGGIKNIRISSEKGNGSMEMDPSVVSEEEIINAIDKGGYKAAIADGTDSATSKKGFLGKLFGK